MLITRHPPHLRTEHHLPRWSPAGAGRRPRRPYCLCSSACPWPCSRGPAGTRTHPVERARRAAIGRRPSGDHQPRPGARGHRSPGPHRRAESGGQHREGASGSGRRYAAGRGGPGRKGTGRRREEGEGKRETKGEGGLGPGADAALRPPQDRWGPVPSRPSSSPPCWPPAWCWRSWSSR